MNKRKTICYEAQQMPNWIMEQLAMGTAKSFLPVTFMKEGAQLTAVYQVDDYKQLSQVQSMPTEDVLQVLSQVIMAMEENEKQYLFSEDYLINRDTVFFDTLRGKIKLIFLPNENRSDSKSQICHLADACKSLVGEEGRTYLENMVQEVGSENLCYRSMVHRCEQLLQEVYVCDIP